jgi:transcriptional regulator with XRE-family HTH domain
MITGAQVRLARRLLSWTAPELAQRAGVSIEIVDRIEAKRGPVRGSLGHLAAIKTTLEAGGIEFTDTGGVRLLP